MESGSVTDAVGDTAEAAGGEDAQRRSIDAVDALLDEVEQALARLDDGSYGRCEQCGEPIVDERLVELAIARTCGPCAGIDSPGPTPVPSAWPETWSEPAPQVADLTVTNSEPATQVADDSALDIIDNSADDSTFENLDDIIDDSALDIMDDNAHDSFEG